MKEEIKVTNPMKTIKRLWGYLKKYKAKIILVTILTIVSTLASIFAPLLMSIALDDFILNGKIKGLGLIAILLAIVFIIRVMTTWLINFIMTKVSENALYSLRKDLFNHLEKLDLSFFDKNKKGDIMSRFTNDVSVISDTLTDSVTSVINSVITLIGVTVIMFIINPILAITTIITVPIFFILVVKIGIKSGIYFSKQQKQLGNLNSYSEEIISGMKVIKSYNKQEKTLDDFKEYNDKLKDISIKANMYAYLVMPVNMAITNLGHILLILVGGIMTIRGTCTVGSILAFTNYSNMFRRPINSLASLYASIQSALAGAERIFEIIDTKIEIKDKKNPVRLEQVKGNVKLIDVNFGYVKNKPILKNININASSGETIALVGKTGAGKTTIINLLTRFYDIDSGQILIDGIDIKDIKISDLRKKIGFVLQDTYLFKGTVLDNIKYGNLDVSDEDAILASKKSQAHNFIHRLPDGYNSFVDEEGSNFSQGERQLIAIARAILSNSEILILDEATSSIDTRTESLITKGMEELMKNKTSFIIAHRLSTIVNADKILVIDDGKIVESGNHEELLLKKGYYYNLYKSQFED